MSMMFTSSGDLPIHIIAVVLSLDMKNTLRCIFPLLLLLCTRSEAGCYITPDDSGHVTIPHTMSSISRANFQSCNALKTIQISDMVSTILDSAFSYCISLTLVTIPDSVESIGDDAFISCTSLTTLIFSDSVSSIGAYAFFSCSSLVNITIPHSMTSLGYMAFGSCTSLTSVTMLTPVSLNFASAFPSCYGYGSNIERRSHHGSFSAISCLPCTDRVRIVLPDSVSTIGPAAFASCTSLTTVIIPDSVLHVYESAFPSCFGSGLQNGADVTGSSAIQCLPCVNRSSIQIPDSVISIGNFTFASCTELSTVVIPNSVVSIGRNAFLSCTSLENLLIPDSVTLIGAYAFFGCNRLINFSISDSVSAIGENAFQFCSSLISVSIPDTVKSISGGIFTACTSLEEIKIPDSVLYVDKFSFVACSSLRSVTIGNSVSSIGQSAFQFCSTLSEVTIPDSLTFIGESAFQFCTSLAEIAIPNAIQISEDAFYGCILCGNRYIEDNDDQYDGYIVSINHIRATFKTPVLSSFSFYHCNELLEVKITDTVQLIQPHAISFSMFLLSIDIPDSVHSIQQTAFQGCLNLASVRIPPRVNVSTNAFFGCPCPQYMYTNGSAIQNCTRGYINKASMWTQYKACSSNEFQSNSGSFTSDTQCTQLTKCLEIAVAATETTDRICASNKLSLLTGAALGVAVETCVIIIISLILWRVYKRKKYTERDLQLQALLLEDERAERRSLYTENYEMKRAWEIPEEDLLLVHELASGGYGSVWRATWGHIAVAVKILRHRVDELDPLAGENFSKEVTFMQKIKHPHLVLFYGAGVTKENMPYLVVEYMQLGSMRQVLLSDEILSMIERLRMASDIACGMRHLHSLGCMHRDLKSDNCLVGDNLRVKVADFGDSRLLHAGISDVAEHFDPEACSASLTRGVGTPLWMAPELLEHGNRYGPEIDVYSFGIILWELVKRHTPWEQDIPEVGVRFSTLLQLAVTSGKRPSLPMKTEFPEEYIALMKRSWSGDPLARPSFAEAAEELSEMLNGVNYPYSYAS